MSAERTHLVVRFDGHPTLELLSKSIFDYHRVPTNDASTERTHVVDRFHIKRDEASTERTHVVVRLLLPT